MRITECNASPAALSARFHGRTRPPSSAYPALSWLVDAPSFGRLLIVERWLSFIYGCCNGAIVVCLTEIMPAAVRIVGFSLAYSLATVLFGGFTPAVSTYLLHGTGNRAMPGAWLSFAAACSLVAALFAARRPAAMRAASPFSEQREAAAAGR